MNNKTLDQKLIDIASLIREYDFDNEDLRILIKIILGSEKKLIYRLNCILNCASGNTKECWKIVWIIAYFYREEWTEYCEEFKAMDLTYKDVVSKMSERSKMILQLNGYKMPVF